MLQVPLPECGPLDPILVFSYNAKASAKNAGFGRGFSDLFSSGILPIGSDEVDFVTGYGQYLVYRQKDGTGFYAAPSPARNALKLNSDDTWTEIQPDGLKLNYDDSGSMQSVVNPAAANWTITRDAQNRPSTVLGPTGRRTTYTYSGDDLASIQDPAGRTTEFTITEEQLVAVTYPATRRQCN